MCSKTQYAIQGELSLPTKWKVVGEVTKLYVFPVKSLAHIEVQQFFTGHFAAEAGLNVDRQFMVVDKRDKLTTSRTFPVMSLIQPEISETHLSLHFQGMESISIEIPVTNALEECKQYEVFGDKCRGVDLGPQVGKWLSEVVMNDPEGGMKLIYHPRGDSTRPDKVVDEIIAPIMKPKDKPYYADGFPYMMMSKSSIDELNKLLEKEGVDLTVEEKRFRPNIFITGEFPPFSEDNWAYVKIGGAIFRHSRLSDRCVFTTVDPFMGDKHPHQEPLKTLRKYRSAQLQAEKKAFGSSPFFGVNLGLEKEGIVSVGDQVYIAA